MTITDKELHSRAMHYIEGHCIEPERWKYTLLRKLPQKASDFVQMEAEELPLVSAFFHEESWYAFTTKLLYTHNQAGSNSIDLRRPFSYSLGDFKGNSGPERDICSIELENGEVTHFHYETGKASMAPIYALRFWLIKYPKIPGTEGASFA